MSPVKWTEIIEQPVLHTGATRTDTTHGEIPENRHAEFIFPQPGPKFSINVFGNGSLDEITLDQQGHERGQPVTIPSGREISYERHGKRVVLEYIPQPPEPSTLDKLTGDSFFSNK
jgi:hypothetical protein